MSDLIERQAVIRKLKKMATQAYIDKLNGSAEIVINCCIDVIERQIPSAQPEWNNHTVACMLAELFGDTCACNYNDIDEWLPEKCELLDSCPNPAGVACWEQYLKHRTERKTYE